MLAVLYPVLVTFLMTFTSAEIKVEFQDTALRQSLLDGMVSDQHLLFQADTSSVLACASACQKYDCCAAFSTSPKEPPSKKVTCRGHDSRSISQSATVDVPGSKTYFIEEKPPASSWLEHSCSSDADCPANLTYVKCDGDAEKCLCEPGYFYTHCRDACIPDCPQQDLQSAFLKYPDRYHSLHNIPGTDVANCNTSEKGQAACLQHPQCRAVDVSREHKCFLQAVTILVNPSAFTANNGADHFQRTCL